MGLRKSSTFGKTSPSLIFCFQMLAPRMRVNGHFGDAGIVTVIALVLFNVGVELVDMIGETPAVFSNKITHRTAEFGRLLVPS
jgi:hypothetical protein